MRTLRFKTNIFLTPVFKFALIVVLFLWASSVSAATLSLSPGTGVYTAGQTFSARVVVNTVGKPVNAADGTLNFNPAELAVVRISKGTMFNLWTAEPSFSNTAGSITFSGGNPTGYTGSAGAVLTITFRAKNAGKTKVSFTKGSVLAADGKGTNVLTSMNGGSYTIVSQEVVPEPETIEYIAPPDTPGTPKVISNTHPDPDKFYTETNAELSWTLPSGITGVRTLLDENSGTIPTKVYDTPISKISLTDLEEGIQYFHIQFRNTDGWGRVAHYRLAIDTKNPDSFDIRLLDDADLSNPIQTLLLETEDVTSKVNRFLIQIDNNESYEYIDETASGTITLPSLEPGYHSVIMEAFDEAGNSIVSTFSFTILAFDKPTFTEYPSQINEEVIPVIKGLTRPNAEVEIRMQKVGADEQTSTVMSSENGEFIFIPDSRLSLGVYELSAVAIDKLGAKSEVSDTIRIAVQQPGYLRIGSFLINTLSVLVPLVALLVLLGIILWYFILRIKRLRGVVRKESKEALDILRVEFGKLEKALHTQEVALQKSRKTKKLTKAEALLIDTLSKALSESKKRVEKEIQDVEDIVD